MGLKHLATSEGESSANSCITFKFCRPILFGLSYCKLSIYLFYLFSSGDLDTDQPKGNVYERDLGPMRGAIPTQSHNPLRLATPPGPPPLLFSNSDAGSFTSHKNKWVKVLWDGTYGFSSLSEKTRN